MPYILKLKYFTHSPSFWIETQHKCTDIFFSELFLWFNLNSSHTTLLSSINTLASSTHALPGLSFFLFLLHLTLQTPLTKYLSHSIAWNITIDHSFFSLAKYSTFLYSNKWPILRADVFLLHIWNNLYPLFSIDNTLRKQRSKYSVKTNLIIFTCSQYQNLTTLIASIEQKLTSERIAV